jgi:hypothetical protein
LFTDSNGAIQLASYSSAQNAWTTSPIIGQSTNQRIAVAQTDAGNDVAIAWLTPAGAIVRTFFSVFQAGGGVNIMTGTYTGAPALAVGTPGYQAELFVVDSTNVYHSSGSTSGNTQTWTTRETIATGSNLVGVDAATV